MIYGHRARIGYLSGPLYAEAYPYEFYKMAPEGVTVLISTLRYGGGTRAEMDECVRLGHEAARAMAKAGAQVIVQGVVPLNLAYGPEGVDTFVRRVKDECGLPATTSVTAQMHALQALGARRIAVLQIGTEPTAGLHDYMKSFGFEVVGSEFAGYVYDDLGRIPPEAPLELARKLAKQYPEADTIYAPAPHMQFVVNIDMLEQETGKNVVSAGQAIMWESLRICGVKDSLQGFGRLFEK